MEFNENEVKIEELSHRSFEKVLRWGTRNYEKKSAQEA